MNPIHLTIKSQQIARSKVYEPNKTQYRTNEVVFIFSLYIRLGSELFFLIFSVSSNGNLQNLTVGTLFLAVVDRRALRFPK